MVKEKLLEKAVQDFQVYAHGVKRLHELEKELESLDTRKFKRQANAIRKKLKNVALIPEIEFDLRKLKLEISGVDDNYEKNKLDKKQSKKIAVLERKSGQLDHIPKLQSRVSYLRNLLDSKEADLEKEISNIKKKQTGEKLTKKEIKEIRAMPSLRGKLNYLRALLRDDIERLELVEDKVKDIPIIQKKLEEDSEKVGELQQKTEKISLVQDRVYYLRKLLDSKEADLEKEIQEIKNRPIIKQLTEQEVKEIRALPNLKNKIDYIKELLNQDIKRLEKVETETGKIPLIQGKLKALFGMLANKSEQIAREEGDIEKLKHKVGYLKHELEEKSEELEHKLISRTNPSDKKRVLEEIYRLREKIDESKLEFNKKLIEGISESRWDIEKEKQDLRKEISELAAESKGLIEQEAQEINEQLLEELNRITKESANIKKELHGEFLEKLLQVREEFDERLEELEKKSKRYENEKKLDERKKDIREEDKKQLKEKTEELKDLPQPFAPMPEFSEIKIHKIKFEKEEPNFDNLSKDYLLPELPHLPEIEFAPTLTKINLESKKQIEELKPNFRLRQEPDIKPEKHLLPQLSKEEFMKDLKQAIIEERKLKNSNLKIVKEIVPKKNEIKKELFLELEDFQNAEQGLEEIGFKIKTLEKGFKENKIKKELEQKEIQNIIRDSEFISKEFSKLNNKILKKIKEPNLDF